MLATALSHLASIALGPSYCLALLCAFILGLISGSLQRWVFAGRPEPLRHLGLSKLSLGFGARHEKQWDEAEQQQEHQQHTGSSLDTLSEQQLDEPEQLVTVEEPPWHVDAPDLHQLVPRFHVSEETGWKHMMTRNEPGVYQYKAYRRALPNGLTEYKSITTCCNTTPRELMEFLLDDSARASWEAFVESAHVLEQRDWHGSKEQVVRLVRKFPFNFLSDREYIIARKVWGRAVSGELVPLAQAHDEGHMYAVTKSMDEHPAAPAGSGLVRTTALASSWMCSWAPDPWNPDSRSAQVVLLHSEDIRIPEYLARTAVSLGMSKFIRDMITGLGRFKQERYARGMHPNAWDPTAYGHNWASSADLVALEAEARGSSQGVSSMAGLRFTTSHMSRSGPGTASSPAICSLVTSSPASSLVSSPTVSQGHRGSYPGGSSGQMYSYDEADGDVEVVGKVVGAVTGGRAAQATRPGVKRSIQGRGGEASGAGKVVRKVLAGLLVTAAVLGVARGSKGRRGRRVAGDSKRE